MVRYWMASARWSGVIAFETIGVGDGAEDLEGSLCADSETSNGIGWAQPLHEHQCQSEFEACTPLPPFVNRLVAHMHGLTPFPICTDPFAIQLY